jgi:aminoglycoside phosphotransferase (APT) family kinase protein
VIASEVFYLRVLPEVDMSFGVEVHIHSVLRQKGVAVPEVTHFEQLHPTLGMSIMVVKEIPGFSLRESSPQIIKNKSILFKAGQQLALVNQIEVEGYSWIKRGKDDQPNQLTGEKTSLEDVLTEHIDAFLRLPDNPFNKSELLQIERMLSEGSRLMILHKSRLVHGDFDDTHIFHNGGRYSGIIDFGEIQGSSPLYDLGHFKLHDGQHLPGFEHLLQGYKEVVDISTDNLLEINLWAVCIAVRRLINAKGKYQMYLMEQVKELLEM